MSLSQIEDVWSSHCSTRLLMISEAIWIKVGPRRRRAGRNPPPRLCNGRRREVSVPLCLSNRRDQIEAMARSHAAPPARRTARDSTEKRGRKQRRVIPPTGRREREKEEAERRCVAEVEPEASLSDPQTPLRNHSPFERGDTGPSGRLAGGRSRERERE